MTVYRAPAELIEAMSANRAEWLPVREVIRSAGEFAVSRYGGDNALEAYVHGLAQVGISIPDPANGPQTAYTARYGRTDYLRVELQNDDDPDGRAMRTEAAWQRVRGNRANMQGHSSIRRVTAIARARGYVDAEIYPGYLDYTYGAEPRVYYVPIEQSLARTITTHETDRATVRAEFLQSSQEIARAILRMIHREANAQGITLSSYESRETREVCRVEPQRRTNALAARVEAAARNAAELAAHDEFLPTDEFLEMMREQAITNHWCPEHHTLIQRLTGGTREPFGIRAAVEFTVNQRFTVDMTSFYGGDGTPEAVNQRLRNALQYAREAASFGTNVQYETNEHHTRVELERVGDSYEPAANAITTADLVQVTASSTARPEPLVSEWDDDDDDQDHEGQSWCPDCNEWHED